MYIPHSSFKNSGVSNIHPSRPAQAGFSANKVPFEKSDLGEKLELPDIAEKSERFTVLVGCWE